MTTRLSSASAVALLTAGVAACVSYSGGARAVDPKQLAAEPGWIVATATPEIHQRGSHDCGAASLAMIAGRWQVPLSVDGAVAALPFPTDHGIELDSLRDAARRHGLEAYAIAGDRGTLVHELTEGRPVIVGLLLPFGAKHVQSHYEVVVAVSASSDRFVTIDPAKGWRTYTWADLDAEWRPAGRATLVVLGPTKGA